MSDWYYARAGQQLGPVSHTALLQAIRAGEVGRADQVWCEGMGDWQPAGQLPQLAAAFAPRPAPAARAAPVPTAVPQPAVAQPTMPYPAAVSSPAPAAAPYAPQAYPGQAPLPPVVAAPEYASASLGYEGTGGEGNLHVSPRAIDLLRQTKPWVRLFSVLLYIAVVLMGLVAVLQLVGTIMAAGATAGGGGGRRTRGVAGGFAAMGLFSVVITLAAAGLYYIPAMYLGRYASRIDKLVRKRRQVDFEAALEAQKSYWKFVGIAALIVMVLYACVLLFAVVLGGVAATR